MIKDIGIELAAENVPADVLFADWEKNGLRKHGNFDLLLYTSGLAGTLDPDVDIWLDEAARNADLAERKEFYCRVAAQINQDLPRIFLSEQQFIAAHRNSLQNFIISPGTAAYTQGSQNWWLRP